MCDAPLWSCQSLRVFWLQRSDEGACVLCGQQNTFLIPGLPVVHCTLSAAFLGPKHLQVSSAGLIGRHSMSISGCRKQKSRYRPRRCPMPQPILCLDEEVYHFAKHFDALFSKPQYQYLVTLRISRWGEPIADQMGFEIPFLSTRAACRGEICLTIPRRITSSAISRPVQWLIGRPFGCWQAIATMWQVCSAVISDGRPGRGTSESRSTTGSSSHGTTCKLSV
jgi:hypothetical protein